MCSLYPREISINGPGIAVHTSHLDGPEVLVWPVRKLHAAWKQWGSSPGRWKSSVLESSECHALVLVFCVFVDCLVRPGCDMGLFCCISYWGFVVIGIAAE